MTLAVITITELQYQVLKSVPSARGQREVVLDPIELILLPPTFRPKTVEWGKACVNSRAKFCKKKRENSAKIVPKVKSYTQGNGRHHRNKTPTSRRASITDDR